MPKSKRLCSFLYMLAPGLVALPLYSHADSLADRLQELKSPDWQVRAKGFDQLKSKTTIAPRGENQIQLALFDLLSRENTYVETAGSAKPAEQEELIDYLNDQKEPADKTESYEAYYGDLIETVARFENPKSIDSLVGSLKVGGHHVPEALARLGPAAIKPLQQKVSGTDPDLRDAAAQTLILMSDVEHCQGYRDDVSRSSLADALKEAALNLTLPAEQGLNGQVHAAFTLVASAYWCPQKG